MASSGIRINSERIGKLLLGIGYCMQGLRCFPWMGVNFFIKDGLQMDPSTLQILQYSSNLPMAMKPLYGILSDSVYIRGQHRVPYIALGALIQGFSWIAIAIFGKSGISFLSITIYLLLAKLGASIAEVANDAIVAETGKKNTSSAELQSFVWMALSIGKVSGNLIGGIAITHLTPQTMFLLFGILLSFQSITTLFVRESSLDLPRTKSHTGFAKQCSQLLLALQKPEISYSILWFALSYAVIPALTSTMFFYQTQHLKIDSSILGLSKVFGQVTMLLWGVVYKRYLKSISSRKLIVYVQIFIALFTISDLLFVNNIYRTIGISDSMYVVIFSGFSEVLFFFFKILPFSVLMAQLCPAGCEGSVMAFVMSAISLAFILSGYLGVFLGSYIGVTGDDFSGLSRGLLVQAACTILPLFWSSFIPEDVKSLTKTKEN